MVCNHKWVFQLSNDSTISKGNIPYYYRTDTYYCKKCLVIKEFIVKVKTKN